MKREKSFRGISERLALQYLENLGGERTGEHAVETDDWRATTDAEKVTIGGSSMELTEVTVVFERDETDRSDDETDSLDEIVERFSQKAMRAGG